MIETSEAVYRTIRQQLLEGRLHGGRNLSQRRLAADLNVSPTNVRRALSRLEAEKLVESRPQSGTFLRQLSPREFRWHYAIRQQIEPYAAGRAGRYITLPQLKRLEKIWCDMDSLVSELEDTKQADLPVDYQERIVRAEHAFHGTIIAAARNPVATHLLENLRILHYLAARLVANSRSVQIKKARAALHEHQLILDALRARDPSLAYRRMRYHLKMNPGPGGSP